jgi:hypothetical protein
MSSNPNAVVPSSANAPPCIILGLIPLSSFASKNEDIRNHVAFENILFISAFGPAPLVVCGSAKFGPSLFNVNCLRCSSALTLELMGARLIIIKTLYLFVPNRIIFLVYQMEFSILFQASQ